MKNKKAKVFVRVGPNVDSNFHRNERITYYVHVLLDFQNAASITSMSYKLWLSNSEWTIYANRGVTNGRAGGEGGLSIIL